MYEIGLILVSTKKIHAGDQLFYDYDFEENFWL